jgi:hypothetical protein
MIASASIVGTNSVNALEKSKDSTTTTVCEVGDIKGSAVNNAMNKALCEIKIGLGDLGYKSTLSDFKSQGFSKCVVGNHDAKEDGSVKLEKESTALCKNPWFLKVGEATLFIGINTNGDLKKQFATIQAYLMDSQNMSGINNIHVTSHKAICDTPPKSHHKQLIMSLCNSIASNVPAAITLYWDNGHNHVYAETSDKLVKTIGSGGKSHYECGTGKGKTHKWVYCNNKNYGFLEYKINNTDGSTTGQFISTTGKVIR